MNDPCGELVVRLGKAQVDAMFGRQDHGPILDDSEFLPLVESVLTAFETAGIDSEVVEELWALPWSLAGGIAGVLVGPNLVAQERRPLGSFLGTIAGTWGGILYLAYERDRERALAGVSYGVLIGMVVGSGLLPALIGSLHLLPRMSSESDVCVLRSTPRPNPATFPSSWPFPSRSPVCVRGSDLRQLPTTW